MSKKENGMNELAELHKRYRMIGERLKEMMPDGFVGMDPQHVGEVATWIADGTVFCPNTYITTDIMRAAKRVVREVDGED